MEAGFFGDTSMKNIDFIKVFPFTNSVKKDTKHNLNHVDLHGLIRIQDVGSVNYEISILLKEGDAVNRDNSILQFKENKGVKLADLYPYCDELIEKIYKSHKEVGILMPELNKITEEQWIDGYRKWERKKTDLFWEEIKGHLDWTEKRCECGLEKLKLGGKHSKWCPKYEEENEKGS